MSGIKLGLILLFMPLVNGYCNSKTVTAETQSGYLSHLYYSSNENCIFSIVPDSEYQNYFLEIQWSVFDVMGDMPNCNEDYIEVYLTRSEKSIGKFCSNNLQGSSLFNMYSHDGYAKIRFHSDKSGNGNGFSLNYRLRSAEYDSLSGYSGCSSQHLYSSSDVFYSSAWPQSYAEDNLFDCKININVGGLAKIVFMDLNLRKTTFLCNQYVDDYVEIEGSKYDLGDGEQIKAPFCSTDKVVTLTTYYDYVYVKFKRKFSSHSSKRGLVAGYVSYSEKSNQSPDWDIIVIVLGVTFPILIILGGVIGCFLCAKHHRQSQELSHTALIQSQYYSGAIPGNKDQYPESMLPSYDEAISPGYQASATVVPDNTPQPAFNPTYGST